MDRRNLVRIRFETADDRGETIGETLWAEPLGGDRFRLRNSPIIAYDVSYEDVVWGRRVGHRAYEFVRVAARGGHSTFRIIFCPPPPSDAEARTLLKPFVRMGCGYDGMNPLISLDVPPGVSVVDVRRRLEEGERKGLWQFEGTHVLVEDN